MTWATESDKTNAWTEIESIKNGYYFVGDYCVTDYVDMLEEWSIESDGVTVWQSL